MPNIKAFVRSASPDKLAHVRFRIYDGDTDLYYKSPVVLYPRQFDNKRGTLRRNSDASPQQREEALRQLEETASRLQTVFAKHRPATSAELVRLMDVGRLNAEASVSAYFEEYGRQMDLSENRVRGYRASGRLFAKFEQEQGRTYRFADVDAAVLQDFYKFMVSQHSNNYTVTVMKRLRAVFNFAIKRGLTENYPFRSWTMPQEVYGTPQYLTIEERDYLYTFDLSAHPAMEVQRDIFIFQCLTGLRVGNLLQLTPANIVGNYLEYIPAKTLKNRGDVVRVPLHRTAREIIGRYKNTPGGKLLPFISSQRYNDYIHEIMQAAGLCRMVSVIDPGTGKEEKRRLCDIASSHMARRTFIGNLYKKVKDPNIIASMSGHIEGSKAFARYRQIDDDIKQSVIDLI